MISVNLTVGILIAICSTWATILGLLTYCVLRKIEKETDVDLLFQTATNNRNEQLGESNRDTLHLTFSAVDFFK